MSGLAQGEAIATLGRLGNRPLVALAETLVRHTRRNSAALLIPRLVSELERPTRTRICLEIAEAPCVDT